MFSGQFWLHTTHERRVVLKRPYLSRTMSHRHGFVFHRMAAESKVSDAMVDALREKVQLRLKEMRIRMTGWFAVS